MSDHWPYCPKCKTPWVFDDEGPFAWCECAGGCGEWYDHPETWIPIPMSLLITSIAEWGNATFSKDTVRARIHGVVEHLSDEVEELRKDPTSAEEMADVFILLAQLAHESDVDLYQAVQDKMKINRKRKWGTADHRGVVKHIE